MNSTTISRMNPIDFVTPMASLEDELLFYPKANLPFRRHLSLIDLNKRTINDLIRDESEDDESSVDESDSDPDDDCPSGMLSCKRRTRSDFGFHNDRTCLFLVSSSSSSFDEEGRVERISAAAANEQGVEGRLTRAMSVESLNFNVSPKLIDEEALKARIKLLKEPPMSSRAKAKNERQAPTALDYIRRLRIDNPISVARQITKFDREMFLMLTPPEMMNLVLCNPFIEHEEDMKNVKRIVTFGAELRKLVGEVVMRETTPGTQGKKIAAFIEVACVLRGMRNWHSLNVIIKGLQHPSIYMMEEAWRWVRYQYPTHFRDYVKLSNLVKSAEKSLLCSLHPALPSLNSIVTLLRLQCNAKWDLLESQRRWIEPPNIAQWLEGQLVDNDYRKKKACDMVRKESNEVVNGGMDWLLCIDYLRHSFLPPSDPIDIIKFSSLPEPWTSRDIRCMPVTYVPDVIDAFYEYFRKELEPITKYKIAAAAS